MNGRVALISLGSDISPSSACRLGVSDTRSPLTCPWPHPISDTHFLLAALADAVIGRCIPQLVCAVHKLHLRPFCSARRTFLGPPSPSSLQAPGSLDGVLSSVSSRLDDTSFTLLNIHVLYLCCLKVVGYPFSHPSNGVLEEPSVDIPNNKQPRFAASRLLSIFFPGVFVRVGNEQLSHEALLVTRYYTTFILNHLDYSRPRQRHSLA